MVAFPYNLYSSSPADVLPTEVFTLFMMLTCLKNNMIIGYAIHYYYMEKTHHILRKKFLQNLPEVLDIANVTCFLNSNVFTHHFGYCCYLFNNGAQEFRLVRRGHKIDHNFRPTNSNIPELEEFNSF